MGRGSSGTGGSVTRLTGTDGKPIDLTGMPLKYGGEDKALAGNARKVIESFEEKRSKNKIEYSRLIDADGNIIEENRGGRGSVNVSVRASMTAAVLTHNHPRSGGKLGGTCFSAEDLNAAFVTAAREIRACHANGYYSIRRQFEIGDYIDAGYKNFARDYQDAVGNFMKTVTNPRWLKGPKTDELAESLNRDVNDYKRTWLRKHAKAYGWEFTEGGK